MDGTQKLLTTIRFKNILMTVVHKGNKYMQVVMATSSNYNPGTVKLV